MNEKTYHKEILAGLEEELTHQKKLLANLKTWVNKCHIDGKNLVNPLQILVSESEAREKSVEKAIALVKKEMN
jgi:uncharacterized coiled-coil protein SlyX